MNESKKITKKATSKGAAQAKATKKAGKKKGISLLASHSNKTVGDLIKVNIIALGCMAGLGVANIGLVWHTFQSKTEVIAITETGSIINPVPLPQAFVNDARVLSFVDTCLRNSFSHDFENYRKTVNDAMECYTQDGGKEFKRELEKTLRDVSEKRLVMSATLSPPSVTKGPFIQNGRATWEVQTLLTVFYQGTRERFAPHRFSVNVTVTRVPLEESISGIAINTIQMERTNLVGGFY